MMCNLSWLCSYIVGTWQAWANSIRNYGQGMRYDINAMIEDNLTSSFFIELGGTYLPYGQKTLEDYAIYSLDGYAHTLRRQLFNDLDLIAYHTTKKLLKVKQETYYSHGPLKAKYTWLSVHSMRVVGMCS